MAAATVSAKPRIDSISPSQGPIAGGTVVTISGSGFTGASVTLDQKPVTPSSVTDAQIQLTMPLHDNGYALIQVSAAGQSSAAEYLYVPPKLADLPPGYITTVAGVGDYHRLYLPARTANVHLAGICRGATGDDIFVVENAQNRVLRVDSNGILEPFAGNGTGDRPPGDGGPATAATIGFPRTCAVDGGGNVYIPDANHRIRRVDSTTGIVSTVAGTGVAGFSGDGGPATAAQISHPNFLAASADGTVYFLDFGNARIRKVATDGTISTLAGIGVSGHSGDGGPAIQAQIEASPELGDDAGALALDRRGYLYLAETFRGSIRRIDLQSGIITTLLPRSGQAPLDGPRSITVDGTGNVFVGTIPKIVEYDTQGAVLASWGNGIWSWSPDGTPLDRLTLGGVIGLALDAEGNVLFTDDILFRTRRLSFQSGLLETVAGIAPDTYGVPGPAVGAAIGAGGSLGADMMFLPSGDLLYGDSRNLRIFRLDRAGGVSIFSGTGTFLGGGDGCPVAECSANTVALEADGAGGYYQTDSGPIYHVDAAGIQHRIAGFGTAGEEGYSGDGGPASEAQLTQPWDLAVDHGGNLFIADSNNNRIRRIDKQTGIITTVAGSGPTNGHEGYGHGTYCGDGGPALEACLNTPMAVAVDPDGNIFINDYYNGRLRKVDRQGTIRTFSGDLGLFSKLYADPYGGLFARAQNGLYRFLADGSRWLLSGIPADSGFSGDGGPAAAARLGVSGFNQSIAVDAAGNLFFGDESNYRIRAIRFGAVLSSPDPIVSFLQGSPQSAPIRTPFSEPLEVTVKASWGSLAPGVRVDFTAPLSGPSCVFDNHSRTISVLTDRDGKASAPCRATCQPGSYTVTATPLASGHSVSFSMTNTPAAPGTQPTLLCLDDQPGDDRFEVEMSYHTTQGGGLQGPGEAISLSSLGVSHGGLFWFFSANNPEVLFKVLNGCGVNSHYWVFSSAGTNVGLDTTVTDTFTGRQKLYTNPDLTAAAPIQDTAAFPCSASDTQQASLGTDFSEMNSRCPAGDAVFRREDATAMEVDRNTPPPARDSSRPETVTLATAQAGSACVSDDTTLCIDSRFRVTIDYQTVQAGGLSGKAQVIPLDSLGVTSGGLFWFFSAGNPELLVKALDGCSVNDKHWLFYAAGTNLGLTVTVTDTETGETRTYTNPDLNPAPPVQDVNAFECP